MLFRFLLERPYEKQQWEYACHPNTPYATNVRSALSLPAIIIHNQLRQIIDHNFFFFAFGCDAVL